jgi:GT2 family glycosyltransferase
LTASLAPHAPARRGEALLAEAAAAFQRGHLADTLAIAEGLVRHYGGSSAAPAALRARVLQACGSPLAARAWDAAWSCDPENPALQDAMLDAWAAAHAGRSVAALGASFLPLRCREGTQASLLGILQRCGVMRVGACWADSPTSASMMCFDQAAPQDARARIVLASEHEQRFVDVPLDGTRVLVELNSPDVWSVAFDGGGILQGSPVATVIPSSPTTPALAAVTGVDVIVPVYKDRAAVRTCIKSVLASIPQNRTRARVIVVDDASSDTAVSQWLDGLAQSGWITLLRNRYNLGFIESANRAMRQSASNHPLLLNADTEVFGNWIDRLVTALDEAPDVASVMPWSNNGEIANLWPDASDRDAPPSGTAQHIDEMAAALQNKNIDIPTCSGFAMLIRRAALADVDLLDGVALSRGYLEEVDWCLRASHKGWRHLLATRVFVTHNGSASFGSEKVLRVRQNRAVIAARYPGYYDDYASFLASPKLAKARTPLLRALHDVGVQWPPRDAQARAQTPNRRESLSPLASPCRRIAVQTDAPGLLDKARQLSAQGGGTRLLVFGHASEALRHTGVVDVVPPDTGLPSKLRILNDAQLMQLCGCASA